MARSDVFGFWLLYSRVLGVYRHNLLEWSHISSPISAELYVLVTLNRILTVLTCVGFLIHMTSAFIGTVLSALDPSLKMKSHSHVCGLNQTPDK